MKIKQVTHNEYVGQVIIDTGLDTDTMYDIVDTVLDFTVNGWDEIPGTTEYKFDVDLSMMDDWEPTDPEYQAEVKRIGQSIVRILTIHAPEPVRDIQDIWDEHNLGDVIYECVYNDMTQAETLNELYEVIKSENIQPSHNDFLIESYYAMAEMKAEELEY
jgi:hypothetical protein